MGFGAFTAAAAGAVGVAVGVGITVWTLRRRDASPTTQSQFSTADRRREAVRKAYEATVTGDAGCCQTVAAPEMGYTAEERALGAARPPDRWWPRISCEPVATSLTRYTLPWRGVKAQ